MTLSYDDMTVYSVKRFRLSRLSRPRECLEVSERENNATPQPKYLLMTHISFIFRMKITLNDLANLDNDK